MQLDSLRLRNFRSYESLELQFDPVLNIITGQNGRGKTNILEAIYMASCARSHRTAYDRELIRHGMRDYEMELFYSDPENNPRHPEFQESLRLIYGERGSQAGQGRSVWHNGLKLERIGELMGLFQAVIFAPEDIMLVKGGPQGRRRFLDILLSRLSPLYFSNLQQYSRVLIQRNRLLKQLREQGLQDSDELYIWDEIYARLAAEIGIERRKLIADLSVQAAQTHEEVSGGHEQLSLRYLEPQAWGSLERIEERSACILERMNRAHRDEIRRGTCLYGPHKDDLQLLLNGQELKLYGSQGQQRTAVLAIKEAELSAVRRRAKTTPILLLDDILPELDLGRRRHILEQISGIQVFITCTDAENMTELLPEASRRQYRRFHVGPEGQVELLEASGPEAGV